MNDDEKQDESILACSIFKVIASWNNCISLYRQANEDKQMKESKWRKANEGMQMKASKWRQDNEE